MKSGSKGSAKELKRFQNMTLSELNENIERCLHGSHHGGTTAARKSYFKRLIWLENIREDTHDIEAPHRNFKII